MVGDGKPQQAQTCSLKTPPHPPGQRFTLPKDASLKLSLSGLSDEERSYIYTGNVADFKHMICMCLTEMSWIGNIHPSVIVWHPLDLPQLSL